MAAFCGNKLEDLVVPRETILIGDRAFKDCNIKNLKILSENELNIGMRAFASNKISEIQGMDAVSHVGYAAFRNNLIRSINLANAERVHSSAFVGNSIKRIEVGKKLVSYIKGLESRESTFGQNDGLCECVDTPGSYIYRENGWIEDKYW